MNQYSGFAAVYDMFMDNVPYVEWTEYLAALLKENGVKEGIVAELGCGTGNVTRRLRDRGYDMIGIDVSPEMLQLAREKESDDSILYLLQDMREFELYGSVAAVVSICDSMNYITGPEDMLKVFKLVNNYLDPGGVFIFDMNTPFYYSEILGEQTICENRESGSFIWENYYDEEKQINEFGLTIYYDGEGKGSYRRYEETHYQRAYTDSEIRELMAASGLRFEAVFASGTHDAPEEDTERVYYICRKQS